MTGSEKILQVVTNRHGATVLLVLLVPVTTYALTSGWAFTPMRDGFLIGSFPLAYLTLCIFFAALMFFGPEANETLPEFKQLSLAGVFRIAAFVLASVFLTFWHETFGFVLLCSLFVAVVSWFAGQRSFISISIYAVGVAIALFGAFTMLGFDLSIAPGFNIGN